MTVLVQDSFIDASLTSLASHTSNTGSGWALLAGGAALITPSGIGLGGSTSGSSIYAPTGGIVFDEGGYVEATFSKPASGYSGWRIGIGALEDNGGATGERIGIDVNFATGTTQFRVVSGSGTYTYTVVDTVSGDPSAIASPFTIRIEPGKAFFNGEEYAIPDFPVGYRPYLISIGYDSGQSGKATITNYEAGGMAPTITCFWTDLVDVTCLCDGETAAQPFVQDSFSGSAGSLVSHVTDSGYGWADGYHGIDGLVLDGTGGIIMDPDWYDTHEDAYCVKQIMTTADYYVEVDVTIPTTALDSAIKLYARIQGNPAEFASGDVVNINWQPCLATADRINASTWGTGLLDVTAKPGPAKTGDATFRIEVAGNWVQVIVDGVSYGFIELDPAHSSLAGWVGFGLSHFTGAGPTDSIVVREFRCGAL